MRFTTHAVLTVFQNESSAVRFGYLPAQDKSDP
jgi:hypothetical protein